MTWTRATVVLGALLALVGTPLPALADAPPAGSTWSEETFPSRDGVLLHADVFRPDAASGRRTPAMLVVTPYLGLPSPGESGPPRVLERYRRLYELAIARGHTIVQVSLRGTGASQGCGDFGGPGEQGDVAAAVEWAATRTWSSGGVGMVGHSYDGFAALVGAAQRSAALRAVVVMAPATSLYRGIFMNGVEYVQTPVVAAYYQAFGAIPPLHAGQAASALPARDPRCAPAVIPPAQNPDAGSAFWRERDLAGRLAGVAVPVLWAHGFLDGRDDYSAVRPDNFLDAWRGLAGPRRAWFGQFPHLVPGERNTWNEDEPIGRDGFAQEALDWLEAHVADDSDAHDRVRDAPPVVVQEGARGRWHAATAWPPAGTRTATLPLLPGAYADGPGTKAEQGDDPGGGCAEGARARCNPFSRTGQGTWTFSEPLPRDVQLSGAARLEASVAAAPGARLVALIYDVGPDGRASLLTRGASLAGGDGRLGFELYPQEWRLASGHRIGVLLAGSDDFYFAPGRTGSTVRVESGALRLPVIVPPDHGLAGEPSRAVRERTSFQVARGTIAARSSSLDLPLTLACGPRSCGASRPRLTRRCVGAGRLRVRLEPRGASIRSVSFRFGRHVVARDSHAPFRRVVARPLLARTRARRLRAVVARRGAARLLVVSRSLPRCGLPPR